MSDFLSRAQAALATWLPRSGRIVAGVSGGPDSLALLHLLAAFLPDAGRRLVAVHVHHGLRGRSADADAAWVVEQCRRLGVLCVVYRRDVAAEARRRGWSLEAAGRFARQAAFLDAARLFRARGVVLAHQRDDRAETLLLNLLRGAGGQGLSALRPARRFPLPGAPAGLSLVRPLLEFSKTELQAYLRGLGVAWRQDRTNLDPRFLRNRLRLRLLPYLEREIQAGVSGRLARSAASLARDDELLARLAGRARARRFRAWPAGGFRLSVAGWARLPEALRWRLLAAAWDRAGLPAKSYAWLDGLQRLALGSEPGTTMALPGGWRVCRQATWLEWKAPGAGQRTRENRPQRFRVLLTIVRRPRSPRVAPGSDYILADADRLPTALTVRCRRPGDRLAPLGMHGRTKTLKRIFSEMEVPTAQRPGWPVLAGDGRILWVFRGPMAEELKLTPASRRVAKIRLIPEKG